MRVLRDMVAFYVVLFRLDDLADHVVGLSRRSRR